MAPLFPSDVERLEAKIDKHGEALAQINVTLAQQHVTLQEHMRRTDANEKHIALVESELKPLTKAHLMWSGAGKLVTTLAVLAGIAEAIYKIFH